MNEEASCDKSNVDLHEMLSKPDPGDWKRENDDWLMDLLLKVAV